tara:strand:- start:327 stop:683 length:357 start_codon:yes stop_codon:yes gene_type:complete
MSQSAPFTKTDLKKMKKDELVALVMKQQEEKEREIEEATEKQRLMCQGTFRALSAGIEEKKKEIVELKEEISMLYGDVDRLLNGKGGVEEKLEEVRDYLELVGQDCAEVFDRIMKGED